MENLADQIVETWEIHARIVLYLLEAVAALPSPEALAATLNGKGRTVADQLAHIHNVRLMWLKASAPELLAGLEKVEKAADSDTLRAALAASAALIRVGLESGRIKNFKPHPTAFVGYLVAHESFHIGKIDMTLRAAGHPLGDKTHYGLFEWGVR